MGLELLAILLITKDILALISAIHHPPSPGSKRLRRDKRDASLRDIERATAAPWIDGLL
jgi:hypothetical protein